MRGVRATIQNTGAPALVARRRGTATRARPIHSPPTHHLIMQQPSVLPSQLATDVLRTTTRRLRTMVGARGTHFKTRR